jgi:ATP-dependent DNA ligase
LCWLRASFWEDTIRTEGLVYAGRAGTGIKRTELERLWRRLQPLAIDSMPLAVPPPRDSRFGSPLVLSRVHWGLVVTFVPKVPI